MAGWDDILGGLGLLTGGVGAFGNIMNQYRAGGQSRQIDRYNRQVNAANMTSAQQYQNYLNQREQERQQRLRDDERNRARYDTLAGQQDDTTRIARQIFDQAMNQWNTQTGQANRTFETAYGDWRTSEALREKQYADERAAAQRRQADQDAAVKLAEGVYGTDIENYTAEEARRRGQFTRDQLAWQAAVDAAAAQNRLGQETYKKTSAQADIEAARRNQVQQELMGLVGGGPPDLTPFIAQLTDAERDARIRALKGEFSARGLPMDSMAVSRMVENNLAEDASQRRQLGFQNWLQTVGAREQALAAALPGTPQWGTFTAAMGPGSLSSASMSRATAPTPFTVPNPIAGPNPFSPVAAPNIPWAPSAPQYNPNLGYQPFTAASSPPFAPPPGMQPIATQNFSGVDLSNPLAFAYLMNQGRRRGDQGSATATPVATPYNIGDYNWMQGGPGSDPYGANFDANIGA